MHSQARSRLELAAKEGEINLLSQQLAAANAVKKKAVAEAEKALTAAWKQVRCIACNTARYITC